MHKIQIKDHLNKEQIRALNSLRNQKPTGTITLTNLFNSVLSLRKPNFLRVLAAIVKAGISADLDTEYKLLRTEIYSKKHSDMIFDVRMMSKRELIGWLISYSYLKGFVQSEYKKYTQNLTDDELNLCKVRTYVKNRLRLLNKNKSYPKKKEHIPKITYIN